jgi:hypothetical protein
VAAWNQRGELISDASEIVLIEPQCWGFEHAAFNSALLATVLRTFPGSSISFVAEEDHLTDVRKRVERWDASEGRRVRFVPIEIPPRLSATLLRFWWEKQWCRCFYAAQGRGR